MHRFKGLFKPRQSLSYIPIMINMEFEIWNPIPFTLTTLKMKCLVLNPITAYYLTMVDFLTLWFFPWVQHCRRPWQAIRRQMEQCIRDIVPFCSLRCHHPNNYCVWLVSHVHLSLDSHNLVKPLSSLFPSGLWV